MSPQHRIFGLDILRAFAILSVVIAHGLPILTAAETDFPWIPTGDGVDLFFALSGYLIGGILISAFVTPAPLGFRDYTHFLKRRWFRTLPNYYLILGLNALFAYYGWNMGHLKFWSWRFLLFSQNLGWRFEGFFWESWSLCVEEWFYFTFPLALLLTFAIFRKPAHRKWLFLAMAVAFVLIPLLLRAIHYSPQIDRYIWDTEFRKVVIHRLDAIAMGLVMAWISRFSPQFWRTARWPMFILGMALFLFMDHYRQPVTTHYAQVGVFLLSSISYALWLPLFAHIQTAPRWIRIPIQHISLISYSMYLIHLALVSEVIQKWYQPTTAVGAWQTYLLYLTIVTAASTLLYHAWERPMMNLRDRW